MQRENARRYFVDVEQPPHAEPGMVGRDTAEVLDGRLARDPDAHVVDELPGRNLEGTDHPRVRRRRVHCVVREGPERDRAHVADAVAVGAQLIDRILHELRRAPERHDHGVGVVELPGFDAHFAFEQRELGRDVLRFAFLPELALPGLADAERRDRAGPSRSTA